jgi:hypothetical protein
MLKNVLENVFEDSQNRSKSRKVESERGTERTVQTLVAFRLPAPSNALLPASFMSSPFPPSVTATAHSPRRLQLRVHVKCTVGRHQPMSSSTARQLRPVTSTPARLLRACHYPAFLVHFLMDLTPLSIPSIFRHQRHFFGTSKFLLLLLYIPTRKRRN